MSPRFGGEALVPWMPLDEAKDPRTSGARLLALLRPHLCRAKGHDERTCEAVAEAVYGNPNLPVDVLSRCLIGFRGRNLVAAWNNPSVPLAMLTHPNDRYVEGAAWALRFVGNSEGPFQGQPVHLTFMVQLWAAVVPETQRHNREARAFARHLASLFSLPWPEEAS